MFAAFLSKGTDASNCGRPCDTHNLKLRDRVGVEHPVKADVGCRNTVYHAKAQSGADFLGAFVEAGARVFRVELLEEDAAKTRAILQSYRELIDGTATDPAALFRRLNVVKQPFREERTRRDPTRGLPLVRVCVHHHDALGQIDRARRIGVNFRVINYPGQLVAGEVDAIEIGDAARGE